MVYHLSAAFPPHAGKTTLLDVLAFRKTTGAVKGDITLNGVAATPVMFARASSFAEQADEHLPTATVTEALLFSASLRTAREGISDADRRAVVADVLDTLELQQLAERQVGTLSRGELKRLSLGVEIASLSGLVFCDEPTTGLSARAAAVVVRCLQRIAARGRTVVCTIHQPSAHLFFAFTHLLLLAPGGHQIYFGPLGHHGREMVAYFESMPGVPALPPYRNPATWMLDITSDQRDSDDAPREDDAVNPTAAPVAGSASGIRGGEAGSAIPGASGAQRVPAVELTTVESPGSGFPATVGARAALSPGAVASQEVRPVAEPLLPPPITASKGERFAAAYASSALASATLSQIERYIHASEQTSGAVLSAAKKARGQPAARESPTAAPAALKHDATMLPSPSSGESVMEPLHFQGSYATAWPTQARLVLGRALRDSWRNSAYTGNRIIAITFLALFFGLLYLELDFSTFQGVQSATGAVLASMGFCGVVAFTIGVPLYMRYRASFYRERDGKFYSPSVHALSLLVVETLWVALLCVVFVAIFYYLIKFRPAFNHFLFYLLGTFVCVLCFMYAAICAAAMFPSSIIAQLAGGVFLSVVFLFAGIFVPRPNCPAGWAWFMYADFAFHLVRALALDQFVCVGGVDVCPSITVVTGSGPQTVTSYSFVSHNLGTGYSSHWADMGIAALIMLGFVVATFAVWQTFNHQKR
jgi:ABC-type multidrug transport system ATPase subunit